MGFDEIWDGFVSNKVVKRTEDGEKFTHAIIKYLQRRHETETKYSKSLSHLSECFKSELEIGTVQDCWLSLKTETEQCVAERQAFADKIQNLLNTVEVDEKEDKRNRAMLIAKGTKLVSDLAKCEDNMKRARAKYVESRRKQDKANEAVQKAKAQGSSNITKFQKAAEKDEKKADKSENEYRISVSQLKAAQDKFYDQDMPQLLREFENHEQSRLKKTKEYFSQFVECMNPLGPAVKQSTERFEESVNKIDVRSDLDLYVNRIKPDCGQPPKRAQYISYDGQLVQDVPGTPSSAPTSTSSTPTLSKSISGGFKSIGKIPTSIKKKKEPEKTNSTPTHEDKSTNPTPTASPDPSEKKATPTAVETNNTVNVSPSKPETVSVSEEDKNDVDQPEPNQLEDEKPQQPQQPQQKTETNESVGIELITLYSYEATEDNELSFQEGETIVLLEKDDSGWWRGRNAKGEEGVFPSNFVECASGEPSSGVYVVTHYLLRFIHVAKITSHHTTSHHTTPHHTLNECLNVFIDNIIFINFFENRSF
eukprot:TRINITY_DN1200_c0_g1_i4.p1 TRINITY_DN1200_c0_g1~~TRINITY_DN1200_c0_g1_i4.p1  ORF type:complete len:536 (+),score=140.84 TRINITY_DN1200_c0_g1_i4:459-2066(+)